MDFVVIETNGVKRAIWDQEKQAGAIYNRQIENDGIKHLWVFNTVKQSFKKYLAKNPKLAILPDFPQSRSNWDNINNLAEGEIFYASDADHCYWRCAYLLGYINSTLYKKMLKPEYKLIRNKAMACTTSNKIICTYRAGELINTEKVAIAEYKTMYNNVRNLAFQLMNDCFEFTENEGTFLKYKTDCIYYKPKSRDIVESLFDVAKIKPKTVECVYIGKNHFLEGDEPKSF